jgi:hypothetical protein
MYEYDVPADYHIKIKRDPARLFTLAIGMLGEYAAYINGTEINEGQPRDVSKNLQFSAQFFDAYLEARLNEDIDPYLLLLGSASYYLCDLPGSSKVLANHFNGTCPDLNGLSLENLMLWILKGNITPFEESNGPYSNYINDISNSILNYYHNGNGETDIFISLDKLREFAYANGTSRQLLFSDIICALLENATKIHLGIVCNNTSVPIESWHVAVQKASFIRELWRHNIFLEYMACFVANQLLFKCNKCRKNKGNRDYNTKRIFIRSHISCCYRSSVQSFMS